MTTCFTSNLTSGHDETAYTISVGASEDRWREDESNRLRGTRPGARSLRLYSIPLLTPCGRGLVWRAPQSRQHGVYNVGDEVSRSHGVAGDCPHELDRQSGNSSDRPSTVARSHHNHPPVIDCSQRLSPCLCYHGGVTNPGIDQKVPYCPNGRDALPRSESGMQV